MENRESKMPQITYNGKVYIKPKNHWITPGLGECVYEGLQKILDKEYEKSIDISVFTFEELWDKGCNFKETGNYSLAIKYLERALELGHDRLERRWILAPLSSAYRGDKMPKKAIELYNKFMPQRNLISAPFLTSVSAAYLDMGVEHLKAAEKLAKQAYAMCDGRSDPELMGLFARIKSLKK